MKVHNMKAETVKMLGRVKALKRVDADYPSNLATFPSAVYRTVRQPYAVDGHKKELQTKWTIVVEIYGDSKTGSLTDIVNDVIEQFSNIGFIGNSKDANTAGINRVICTFTGLIDNTTLYGYQN